MPPHTDIPATSVLVTAQPVPIPAQASPRFGPDMGAQYIRGSFASSKAEETCFRR
jgi:hypothetical protein